MTDARFRSALLVTAFCAAPLATSVAAGASASDPTSAAQLFQEALRDYDRGDLAAAIAKLEQAQAAAPRATVLYNLALILEAAGRRADACNRFEQYLATPEAGGDAERQESVRAKVASLRQSLASLRIETSPAASIRIDGRDVEPASELLVEPGVHELRATVDGFEPARLELRAVAGETQRVLVQLKPIRTREPPRQSLPAPAASSTQPSPMSSPLGSSAPARPWATIALVTGATFAGAAVLTHFVNASRDDAWQARNRELDAVPAGARGDAYWQGRAENAELARSIRHLDGLELGLFIGAGVLATTGVGIWLTSPTQGPSPTVAATFQRSW